MERIGKIMVIPSSMMVKEARNINDISKTFTLDMLATEDSCEDEEVSFVPLQLPSSLESRLFDHQKDGVKWMHGLYLKGSGGILGDDMGLGKTFQVTCLLTGLMCKKLINTVLIVAPVSVLPSWHRELMEHMVPHVDRISIELTNSDMNKKKRQKILADIFESGNRGRVCPSVVVTSYHLVANMVEDFCAGQWDYVVLDEGHLIKNHQTKNSKAMHMLQSRHRLVLTGTPVQNNLNEFWTIADWATSGRRFGSLASFKDRFATPISNGQDPHASDMQRAASGEAIKRLMALTKPILLQRKKCEQPAEQLKLPDKVEVVVWVPLASTQRKVYEQFLQSRAFSSALSRTTYPVEVINHLKTLCRHPFLLEASDTNAKRKAQLTERSERSSSSAGAARGEDEADDLDALTSGLEGLSLRRSNTDSSTSKEVDVGALEKLPAGATVFEVAQREPALHELFQGSVKLRVLAKLVFRLHREGHRTLVFSQSRMMLDIIQRVLAEYRLASYRIDGTTAGRDRQRIIDEFNDPGSEEQGNTGPSICLLTTKACGTGITLTGADRVVIFDPSWNPAEDRQAVDRAFRIGQKKNVVVYRLVMASSVEEKMYEKQVFKDGLRVVTESGSSSRYFSSHETRALFTLGPADKSVVMEKFWEAAGGHPMRTFDDTGGDLPGVLGFTRHDTLYAEVRPQEVQDTTKDQSAHREGSQQWIGGNSGVVNSNKENERSSVNRSVMVDLVEGPFSKGGNRGGSSGSAAAGRRPAPRVEMDLTSPPKATVLPKPPTTAATGNKTVIDLRTSNSVSGDDDDLVDTDEEGATATVKSGTSRLVRGGNRGRVIVVESDSEQEQDEEVATPAARYFEAEATEGDDDEELDEEQEEESGDCGEVDLDMGALTLSDEETPFHSSLDSIVCSDATLLVEPDVSGRTNSIDIEAERAEAQEEDCDRTKSFIVLEAEGEDREDQEQEAVVGGVAEGTVAVDKSVADCSAAVIGTEPHQSSPLLRLNNEQGQQEEEDEHFSDCDGGDDSCFPEDGAGGGLLADLCELGSRSSTVTSVQDTSSCSSNASNESFHSSYSAPRSSSALTPTIVAGTDVLSDASAACEWRLLPAELPQQQPAAESYLFGFANPDIFSSPAPNQQTRSSLTATTGSKVGSATRASIASSSILDLEQQLLAMAVHPSTPTTKVSFQTAPLASPLSAADISAVGVDFGGKLTIVASSAKRSRRSSFTAACMSSDSDDSERDSDAEHSSEDSDCDSGDESDCVTREQEGEEEEEDCPVVTNLLSKFTDSPSGVSPSSSPLNDSPARSTPDRNSSSSDGVQLFPEEDQEENEQCYFREVSLSGGAVEQFSDSLASPEKQQLELSPEIGVGEVSDSWAVSEALLEREEEEEEEEEEKGQQGEGDGECGESVSVLDDLQPQFISPGPFTTAEEESSSASVESDSPVATDSPPLFEKALPSTPLLVRTAALSVSTPELPPLSSPSEEQEEALDWSHFMHIPVLPVTDKEEEAVENFEMSVLAARNAALLEALRDMGSDLGECCVFESQLPVSALDQTALQQYNELISRGAAHEAEGQLEAAGEAFLCALGLCDEDIALHGKLAWLLQTLSVAAEEQQ